MSRKRFILVGVLLALALAFLSIAAAVGDDAGAPRAGPAVAWASYSGDDDYDPAAGGRPERSPALFGGYSGDDVYDPAAGSYPEQFVVSPFGGYSGDDAYDPAAGGNPL